MYLDFYNALDRVWVPTKYIYESKTWPYLNILNKTFHMFNQWTNPIRQLWIFSVQAFRISVGSTFYAHHYFFCFFIYQ